ncbi:MAG: HDOD domain-containing protein [Magnetococcales bacterium]|nr:HDOD domain-containing protein [Magnetococcales bacterium]
MPAFPQSVYRILQLTTDINCPPKELIEIIGHDPVLTLKILKILNSPYFGLSRTILSINQAVVFVGINTIKNIALTIAPVGVLTNEEKDDEYLTNLLMHSLGTAIVAKRLSRRLGASELESADYFVAGLLHDFGKVVLARYMPKEYAKAIKRASKKNIPFLKAEKKLLGTDHTRVGAMLAKKWHLPNELVASIQNHHAPRGKGSPSPMGDCVFAANQIVKKLRIGKSGNPVVEQLPPPIASRFNMDLGELINSLGDFSNEWKKTWFILHQG